MYLRPFNDIIGIMDDDMNIYFSLQLYPSEEHAQMLRKMSYDDLAEQIANEDLHARYLASLDAIQNLESTNDLHIGNDYYGKVKCDPMIVHTDKYCDNCAFNPKDFKRKHGINFMDEPYLCVLREIYNRPCNIVDGYFKLKD